MSHHASGPDFGFPRGDARLDMTDLYAFPKPGDPGKSILILNVHPSVAVNPPGPTTKEPFGTARMALAMGGARNLTHGMLKRWREERNVSISRHPQHPEVYCPSPFPICINSRLKEPWNTTMPS